MPLRFGLVIYWSPEDQAFLVEVPELPGCKANGQSYEEAVANARVVIEEWIQTAQELGRPIPEPQGKLILGTTAGIARCHPGFSWIARCHPGSFSSQGWHSRNYLPHFDAGQTIQHITYRLADALPQVALTKMQAQCEKLGLDDPGKQSELRRRIEAYLDAGHGSCILQLPEIAQMIIQNWMHFDQQRYRLLAWVVMPNHVHVLIEPINEWPLNKIVATWKTYTGKRIREWKRRMDEEKLKESQDGAWRSEEGQDGTWRSRKSQGGTWRSEEGQDGAWRSGEGRIWQREYWDRYMRNEQHYWTAKAYIENNPVKAGLVTSPEQWPWSSATAQWNVYHPW